MSISLGDSAVKNLSANAGDKGDAGLIPGLGRYPAGRHGNPFWCSCLEKHMKRGDWWATYYSIGFGKLYPLGPIQPACFCK